MYNVLMQFLVWFSLYYDHPIGTHVFMCLFASSFIPSHIAQCIRVIITELQEWIIKADSAPWCFGKSRMFRRSSRNEKELAIEADIGRIMTKIADTAPS